MSELSPESVMKQVRQNMVYTLAANALEDTDNRRMLFELLSQEDMEISDDFLRKALSTSEGELGFVRCSQPVFYSDHPKPVRRSLWPSDVWDYIKQYLAYVMTKGLLMFLPRILKFETQTRAFIICDPQKPKAQSASS